MNVTSNSLLVNSSSTGAIPTMVNVYVATQLLVRAIPYMVFEKFGQVYPLPEKSTRTIKFRRYEALDATPTKLTEGVTPSSQNLTVTDLQVTLDQYGNLVQVSDLLLDTTDSPVLQQATAVVAEQAAEMLERIRIGVLVGGSNVEYANGTARSDVNTAINTTLQRRITRKLQAQRARNINEVVRSTPSFNTENVSPGFVAICHPDCDADIREMKNFIDVKDYGSIPSMENEIGAVEKVRYLYTDLLEPFADAGGASSTMLSTSGTNADVYPILYIAKDAYGIVPFKGNHAVTPIVLQPTSTPSDPLAQRGHIGWKAMQTAVILNQAWMVRAEVAVSKL